MGAGGRLPGVPEHTTDRVILHVDVDCFYAACERLREPELRGKPVIVGMGFEPGQPTGAVASASYEAREFGIKSAQSISKAMNLLPPRGEHPSDSTDPVGYYRPVDREYYRAFATEIKRILKQSANTVRSVSIDEAYLDCTDRTTWSGAKGHARLIKRRIVDEIGLPVSIGVAPNMSTAKIASDFDKPNGLVIVRPGRVKTFLAPIPIEELHGVGPVTQETLANYDIQTIGDLAAADRHTLHNELGTRGRELYERANGVDHREVSPTGNPKSLSRESAFDGAITDRTTINTRIRNLAEDVAARARDQGATYRTIGIKLVTPPFEIHTRERSLPGPVDDPALVQRIASELLEEFDDERIRKIGVRVSNLSFVDGDQARLDGWANSDGTLRSSSVAGDSFERLRACSRNAQVSLDDFGDVK